MKDTGVVAHDQEGHEIVEEWMTRGFVYRGFPYEVTVTRSCRIRWRVLEPTLDPGHVSSMKASGGGPPVSKAASDPDDRVAKAHDEAQEWIRDHHRRRQRDNQCFPRLTRALKRKPLYRDER